MSVTMYIYVYVCVFGIIIYECHKCMLMMMLKKKKSNNKKNKKYSKIFFPKLLFLYISIYIFV